MGFAKGTQRSDAGEARTHGPRSRVKNSTAEPLITTTYYNQIVSADQGVLCLRTECSMKLLNKNEHTSQLHVK